MGDRWMKLQFTEQILLNSINVSKSDFKTSESYHCKRSFRYTRIKEQDTELDQMKSANTNIAIYM